MSAMTQDNVTTLADLRGASVVATCTGHKASPMRGVIERTSAGIARLQLQPSETEVFGGWPTGAAVRCKLPNGRIVAGIIVTSMANTVWLRIGGKAAGRAERRAERRRVVSLPVAFRHDDFLGIGLATDLSPGGMRLRCGEELPPNTRITLRFSLPDDSSPVDVEAVSLWSRPDPEEAGTIVIGLKFVGLSPEMGLRLRRAAVC
jgi:hypothetical protein